MPFFSVIIPLYNKEKYILESINSVLSQTFKDFELIVINDCSTDGSAELVKQISDSKIRVIEHEKNKGLSSTRNTGILNSKGEYLCFLDADDIYEEVFLEKMHQLINNFPDAKIFGSNYCKFDDKKEYNPDNLGKIQSNYNGYIDYFEHCFRECLIIPSSLIVSNSLSDELKYFDENLEFLEDIDYYIKNCLQSKLAYTTMKLSKYRINVDGKMSTGSLKGKRIMDFEKYKNINPNLDKYLNFQKYQHCKTIKPYDKENYKKIYQTIDLYHLTWKQKAILIIPNSIMRFISKLINFLKTKGINWNSY